MNEWYKKLKNYIYIKINEIMKEIIENEERKKAHEQYHNTKSFLSAALGALVVNMLYYYFKF